MDKLSHDLGFLQLREQNVDASSETLSKEASRGPTFEEEAALWQQGFRGIAGVDEVGRGPLAGPVVAAAVVLFPASAAGQWIDQVRDSKVLSPRQREELAPSIIAGASAVGLGVVSHDTIDHEGIVRATHRAMLMALRELPQQPDFILLDGRDRIPTAVGQKAIIKGDRYVISIAAASIVAKVHRDQIMEHMDAAYPGWGFRQHKGYATSQHLEALRRLGPSPVHRHSFSPVGQRVTATQERLFYD